MIPLQVVDLLSPEESQEVWSKVLALRHLWRSFGGGSEFAVGASSYLDGPTSREYFELAAKWRPLLLEKFGWLYERIQQAVAPVLRGAADLPVSYSDELGLPGFVCLLDSKQRQRWAGVHVDFGVQTWMKFENQTFDLGRCGTFTLPVHLPPTSCGLLVWPQITANHVYRYAKKHGIPLHEASKALARHFPFYERQVYVAGQLVIHSGQILHEAEAWDPPNGEGRITLQGHAVVRSGKWELFW